MQYLGELWDEEFGFSEKREIFDFCGSLCDLPPYHNSAQWLTLNFGQNRTSSEKEGEGVG